MTNRTNNKAVVALTATTAAVLVPLGVVEMTNAGASAVKHDKFVVLGAGSSCRRPGWRPEGRRGIANCRGPGLSLGPWVGEPDMPSPTSARCWSYQRQGQSSLDRPGLPRTCGKISERVLSHAAPGR
jgi:hypothetical protein